MDVEIYARFAEENKEIPGISNAPSASRRISRAMRRFLPGPYLIIIIGVGRIYAVGIERLLLELQLCEQQALLGNEKNPAAGEMSYLRRENPQLPMK